MGSSCGNEGNFVSMGMNGYEYGSPDAATRTKGAVLILDVTYYGIMLCECVDCGQRDIEK